MSQTASADNHSCATPPEATEDPRAAELESRILALKAAGDKGARWFFWVAALSLLNSILVHGGAPIVFVVGLGVTLVTDSVAAAVGQEHPDVATFARVIAVSFAIIVSGIVAVFGILARKRYLTVFALGMVLYIVDGLVFVWLQDWLSVAFHGFALVSMWSGFIAYRQLGRIDDSLRLGDTTPPAP